MADFTVTIPDAIMPRLLDAVAGRHGYQEGGGKTKAQFARQQVKLWLRDQLEMYEGGQAADDARRDRVDGIRTEIPDE